MCTRSWAAIVAVGISLAATLAAGCGSEPDASPAPTWEAGFELHSLREWSYWDRDDGGTFYATDAEADGVTAQSGSAVARFEVTADEHADGREHSKVYKTWALAPPETGWNDDADRRLERLPGDSPDGRYSAWFFIPEDYDNVTDTWANIFQFKESYLDTDGDWQQDPQWWVDLSLAGTWEPSELPAGTSDEDPLLAVNAWHAEGWWDPKPVAAPVGRWFELTAELHSGDRIDWHLDGRLFDTSPDDAYPVGISKGRPTGWTFGVGHYGGVGQLWVDSVAFRAG